MKVIVHPGRFHLDEVVAVSLLKLICEKNSEELFLRRCLPTQEELDDPETWVVDVGGIYNPALRNFDHHQDRNLQCAAVLVAEAALSPEDLKKLKSFLQAVDEADRGNKTSADKYGRRVATVRSISNMLMPLCLAVPVEHYEEELTRLFLVFEPLVREVLRDILTGDNKEDILKAKILAGPLEMWGPWTVLINDDPRVAFAKIWPGHQLAKETGIDLMITKNDRGNFSVSQINPNVPFKDLGLNKDSPIDYVGFWSSLEELKSRF